MEGNKISHHGHIYPGHRVEPTQEMPGLHRYLKSTRVAGRNSYCHHVQDWLAETCPEVAAAPDLANSSLRRDESLSFSHGPSKGAVLEPRNQAIFHKPCTKSLGIQRQSRRRRRLSSSGSFLELGTPLQAQAGTGISGRDEETRLDGPTPSAIGRRTENPSSTLFDVEGAESAAVQPNDVFHKRKRHKTRKDHYDHHKRVKETFDHDKTGSKNPRREKSGRRRKILKRSGDDLMHEFSSRNVGQDRLTMRPLQTLGLFKNGRASSPALRRGLPDLAFSEMEFLLRANDPRNDGEKKLRSKSQEKEKRKSERAHDEISAYFDQTPNPVREGVLSEESRPLVNSFVDELAHVPAERGNSHYQSSCVLSPSTTVGTKNAPLFGSSHSQGSHHGRDLESNRAINAEVSDDNTTYYTWSETINTTNPAAKRQISSSRISATPESIRRSLDKTGIFKDTGIDRSNPRTRRDTQGLAVEFIDSDPRGAFQNTVLLDETRKVLSVVGSPSQSAGGINIASNVDTVATAEPTRMPSRARHEFRECKVGEFEGSQLQTNGYQPNSGLQIRPTDNLLWQPCHASTVDSTPSRTSRRVLAQTVYVSQDPAQVESLDAVCHSKSVTGITGDVQPDSSALQDKHIECGKDNTGISAEKASSGPHFVPCTVDINTRHVPDSTAWPQQSGRSSIMARDSYLASAATPDIHKIATQADNLSGNEITENLYVTQPLQRWDGEFYPRSLPNRTEESPMVAYRQTEIGQQVFAGLPRRGYRPDRTITSLIQPPGRFALDVTAPLYCRQLRKQDFLDSIDVLTGTNTFQDDTLDNYESSDTENKIDEDNAASEEYTDHYLRKNLYTQDEERHMFTSARPNSSGTEVGRYLSRQELISSRYSGGSIIDAIDEEFRSARLIADDYGLENHPGFDDMIVQGQDSDEAKLTLAGFWRPQRLY